MPPTKAEQASVLSLHADFFPPEDSVCAGVFTALPDPSVGSSMGTRRVPTSLPRPRRPQTYAAGARASAATEEESFVGAAAETSHAPIPEDFPRNETERRIYERRVRPWRHPHPFHQASTSRFGLVASCRLRHPFACGAGVETRTLREGCPCRTTCSSALCAPTLRSTRWLTRPGGLALAPALTLALVLAVTLGLALVVLALA